MPGCNIAISGLLRDCEPNMGGIAKIFFIVHDFVVGKPTVTNEKITAITTKVKTPGETPVYEKFKEFFVNPESSSLTSTLNADRPNGILNYLNELAAQFNRMDTVKRIEATALAVNGVAAIVLDNNGKYWYLGYDQPAYASAGDGQTGQARTDANKYGITIQDFSLALPYEVDPTIIANIVEARQEDENNGGGAGEDA